MDGSSADEPHGELRLRLYRRSSNGHWERHFILKSEKSNNESASGLSVDARLDKVSLVRVVRAAGTPLEIGVRGARHNMVW